MSGVSEILEEWCITAINNSWYTASLLQFGKFEFSHQQSFETKLNDIIMESDVNITESKHGLGLCVILLRKIYCTRCNVL